MKKILFCLVFVLTFSCALETNITQNFVFADEFGLKIVPGCGFNDLSWNAVKGTQSYWIYRGPGKGKEYKTPLTDFPIKETSFHDDIGIQNGQEYCYFVTAVDKDAKEIAKSTESCATPVCDEMSQIPTCKLILKYQVDNAVYWINDDSKGPMETPPIIINSRMFLVIRYVTSEIEGTTLEWVASEKKVKIATRKGRIIELWIGKKDAKINGKTIQIDPNNPKVVPVIKDGRTLMPMRFIGENLGASGVDGIKWFESTKTVEINVDDPVCEKEGLRYPKATERKGQFYEFSVEYHTTKGDIPQVTLGLAKSDNSKVLRLGKSKRNSVVSDDLTQVKTPEPKTSDIKSSFGKAKLFRWSVYLEPGILHFYKFTSPNETLPVIGYLGPVSSPPINAIDIGDVDLKKLHGEDLMRVQGYFTNEPYPMIVNDYWKIYERAVDTKKGMIVNLPKGQSLDDGTFVCLLGESDKKNGTGVPILNVNRIEASQKIVFEKPRMLNIGMTTSPLRDCPNKFALIYAGVLDNAVLEYDDTEYSYKRLRVDFVGEALSNYKTCFNLGMCKKNIYVCFGSGDPEIDLISSDDGDGNPFDFEWVDRAYRRTMERDAQNWWRADDTWRVKLGSGAAFAESVAQIKTKIDLLPSDVTPEVYIMIGTHGNTDIIGTCTGGVITYSTIVDDIKSFISGKSFGSRSKVRVLLDTCHAGSILDNMENNFKVAGNDYIEVGVSSSANELGYGIWPEDKNEPSYEGAGGSYGIPFRQSLNNQAKENPNHETDWKVAHDYSMLNDIFVFGVEDELDNGSIVTVYTHPQYWHSRDRSMYYAGPAFADPTTINDEIRMNTCIIGADMTNAQLDICNCSQFIGDVHDYPKATFTVVNNGIRTFTVDSIEADETVIQKKTTEDVLLFSDRENQACISGYPFNRIELKSGESVTYYMCAIHWRMKAQPLDENGYMVTEGGLPVYIQVPIRIRYYSGRDYFTLTSNARLRVQGDGYETRYRTLASRNANIKSIGVMDWDPVETEVEITPQNNGLEGDVLAGPNFNGDLSMYVKTDIFKTSSTPGVKYGYLKAFKIEFPMSKVSGLSCNDESDWGFAYMDEVTGKLKDKVKLVGTGRDGKNSNAPSLTIMLDVKSTEGFNPVLGRHKFKIHLVRNVKYICDDRMDRAGIDLDLTIEFTDPTKRTGVGG